MCLWQDDVTVCALSPAPEVSNRRSLPTPKIGVTVYALRCAALGSPLRFSPLSRRRFCWYTMEALSAQARITVNTDTARGEKPRLRCDSQITQNYIFPILEFLVCIFSNQSICHWVFSSDAVKTGSQLDQRSVRMKESHFATQAGHGRVDLVTGRELTTQLDVIN